MHIYNNVAVVKTGIDTVVVASELLAITIVHEGDTYLVTVLEDTEDTLLLYGLKVEQEPTLIQKLVNALNISDSIDSVINVTEKYAYKG